MRQSGISSQRGYKAPKGMYGGKPNKVVENILTREFEVDQPNQWWVSDVTYIHTHEGFLYLAVVMDLFARVIVGWSMGSESLVHDAIMMAYWRPVNQKVICTFIQTKAHKIPAMVVVSCSSNWI